MKILLTGAAGYIGTVFRKKYECVSIDNFLKKPKILTGDFYEVDICDIEKLIAILVNENIDVIINLAAVVGDPACAKYKEQARLSNIDGVKSVAAVARVCGIKLVQASTCSVYGFSEGIITEESEVNPLSYYAETKVEAERAIMDTLQNYCILRFSTACGWSDNMRFDLTVNEFVKDAYLGKEIEVYQPDNWRPYADVEDISDVLYDAATTAMTGNYNVGHNQGNHTKRMILDAIREQMECKYRIVDESRDNRNYYVDFSKLNRPMKNLSTSIREIIEKLNPEGNYDDTVYRSDCLCV